VTRLDEVVRRGAADAPRRAALVHGAEVVDFAALADRVGRGAVVAEGLAPPGGRIATVGPNHPGWVELQHAVPAVGRVLVFLNHRLTAAEQAALLHRSGASAVVGEAGHLERLEKQGVELPMLDRDGWASARDAVADRTGGAGTAGGVEPAWLLYTSGTTAAPKGATLTHSSVLAAVRASAAARPVEPDDVYLFAFPLCHVAAYNVVHRHAHGRTVVLLDGFAPAAFCDAVQANGVTSTSLAATMLAALLDHVDAAPGALDQLATLRAVAYGAAPMPPALLRRAHDRLGVDLAQGYGMTELSGNAVFLDAATHRRGLAGEEHLLGAAGRPAPGVELRIVDEGDRDLPDGSVGEILVRAPQVMAGYWDDPDATAAALRGGWLHTGDLGRVDDEGLLHVVDRRKDVVITGGENVSSREVEDVLHDVPGVARVAVVGVPDPTWGENVCAVVVARPDVVLDPADLVATARARLAGFKVPRHVVMVDELPVNAAGKVVKAEVRAWLAAEPGRAGPRL
jgi:acyl-CoA synthetase (AMP-forming)/AMP-acid ligase II